MNIESMNADVKIELHTSIFEILDEDDLNMFKLATKNIPKSNFTILAPVHEEDKLVNFIASGVRNNLIYIDDEKPIIWQGVTIVNMFLPHTGSIHVVVSSKKSVSFNRRAYFRVPLLCGGTVKAQDAELEKDVMLKNLSESGIAFIMKDDDYERGDVCQIRFADAATDIGISIPIVIVRKEKVDDSRFLYGAVLKYRSEPVAKLISLKQQDYLKNKKDISS